MSDLSEALQWLNRFDESHLGDSACQRLDQLKSGRRSSQEIKGEIEKLANECKQHADPLEYPEVLVHGGIIAYQNGYLDAARDYLQDAQRSFEGNHHRKAITQWMLGFIEWELQDTMSATRHWESVRSIFAAMGEWYLDQVEQFYYDTRVTRAALFEEAFGWLNKFEPSHLARTARELQLIMDRKLNEIEFTNASAVYQLMDKLVDETRRSIDFMEIAEAHVECGWAAYRMGNMEEAIRYLELGIHQYHPGTHQQAVAKWLAGIVEWNLEDFDDLARRNWQEAIETFEQVGLNALHRNRLVQNSWYTENMIVMNEALTDKIRSVYG